MQTEILQSGFFPHMLPEGIQPIPRGAQVSDREDPLGMGRGPDPLRALDRAPPKAPPDSW